MIEEPTEPDRDCYGCDRVGCPGCDEHRRTIAALRASEELLQKQIDGQAKEIDQLRERHKASLRRADEINNRLMEEVQRYAEGAERPVLWSVYNEMHLRADAAEGTLKRVQQIVRRLSAHAAGFQDELDDSDRGPWGKTVGADIAELIEVLADQPAAKVEISESR